MEEQVMDKWIPIEYRDFWDVPRIFITRYQGKLFLFDCAFDEATEDFPDFYQVYLLPNLDLKDPANSWPQLSSRAIHCFGKVPIEKVRFDPTRRREIDSSVLEEMTATVPTR